MHVYVELETYFHMKLYLQHFLILGYLIVLNVFNDLMYS